MGEVLRILDPGSSPEISCSATGSDNRHGRPVENGGCGRGPHWHNGQMFLGENLLMWLILALGGALFAGNLVAMIKPPPKPQEGDLERAPIARSLFMSALGLVAAIWALATLVSN